MKKTVTITITLNTETGFVEGLDMLEGIYNRTSVIEEDIDEPTTIDKALHWVGYELAEMIDD